MRFRFHIVTNQFLLVVSLTQPNHIYVNEAWTEPSDKKRAWECEQYAAEPMRRSRYPWSDAVWRPGRLDMLYGTSYAQEVIWNHQHPASCDGVKYLTMLHWPSGIGSLLHFLARALGLALQLGRVLVLSIEKYDPRPSEPGMPWYDRKHCRGKVSWECWFLPLTSCVETAGSDTMVIQPEMLGRFRVGNFSRHYVPDAFLELLAHCAQVKPQLRFHWWHAQAMAYIVRFNPATQKQLSHLRQQLLVVGGARRKIQALRRGTIAMHVRRGDKAVEMPLLPFVGYMEQAHRLASGDPTIPVLGSQFSSSGSVYAYPVEMFAGRALFVSTEDPEVIREALATSWQVTYTSENRTNVDVATMRRQKGNGRATLESFLNLEIALEADAWICTLFSNWCQLIDELRMTVGNSASSPYINLVRRDRPRGESCPPFDRDCYINWR